MRASVHGNLCVHRRHFKKACFVVLFPLGCSRNQAGGAERREWACTTVGDMLCGGHTSTCLKGVVLERWTLHTWLLFQRAQHNCQPWGAQHQNQTKPEGRIRNPSSPLVFKKKFVY